MELTPRTADSGRLAAQRDPGSGVLMALFLAVLLIPITLNIAGLKFSPYRIFLLVLFLPFLFRLLSGRAGRVNMVDAGMAGYSLWMIVTLVYHHGVERFPFATIMAVEMFGGYLIGRILVRSVADYRRFIRYFLVALIVLAPFAIYELFSSRMFISDILGGFFDVTKKNPAYRFGLSRVQVVFPHSILYGLFCSLIFASVYYIYRSRPFQMIPRIALIVGMTFMSLSSAPFLSIGIQFLMILWDRVMRGKWKLLAAIVLGLYIFLEVASNRGAIVVFIETLTLNSRTAWWRVYIWQYGSASALSHPIMGIGLNDWVRPYWLTSSVDNFWLLAAMRHGLVGAAFLGMAVIFHTIYVLRATLLNDETRLIRTAYGVSLFGLLFVLSTVHVWNEVAVLVMMFLGAGSFLYSAVDAAPEKMADTTGPGLRRPMPFSRFPQVRGRSRQGSSKKPEISFPKPYEVPRHPIAVASLPAANAGRKDPKEPACPPGQSASV